MFADDIKSCDMSNNAVCKTVDGKENSKNDMIRQNMNVTDKKAKSAQEVCRVISHDTSALGENKSKEMMHSEGCLCLENKGCLHDMHPFLKESVCKGGSEECKAEQKEFSGCDGCEK